MYEYPVRLTMKSMYSESTWTREGKVSATSPIFAQQKAKELAVKTELHLTGSFIIKIEVKTLNFKSLQEEWTEVN